MYMFMFLKMFEEFFLLLFVKEQRFLEYECVSNYMTLLPLKITTPCVLPSNDDALCMLARVHSDF